jgi:hypothetical protein
MEPVFKNNTFESQSNEQTISKIDIGLEIDFVCTEDEIQNEKKKRMQVHALNVIDQYNQR